MNDTARPSPDALLNPRLDFVFKALFTAETEDAGRALALFLSAAIGRSVSDVVLQPNELPPEGGEDKRPEFDLTCKVDGSDPVNVEMQGINRERSFGKRVEYHAAHLLNHYTVHGQRWNAVPRAFQISVLDFTFDGSSGEAASLYQMRTADGRRLADRMNVLLVELPKVAALPDEPVAALTALQRWGKFLLYAGDPGRQEYIRALAREEEGIMYAKRALDDISTSEAMWLRQNAYYDALADEAELRGSSRDEGIAIGRKEGIIIGRKEGIAIGRDEGIAIGRDEGIAIGRDEGIAIGRKEGIAIGRDEGIAIGRDEGRNEGRDEGIVKAIRGLMKGMSVSADKAISMIGIAEADRAAYAELLRT